MPSGLTATPNGARADRDGGGDGVGGGVDHRHRVAAGVGDVDAAAVGADRHPGRVDRRPAMVAVTVLVAVSITDTVSLPIVGDVDGVPSGLTATPMRGGADR